MKIDDAEIERLVGDARSGDGEAFGRLFDHFHVAVHRYIASRVRRPSDAEDLTQMVFVKALEALPRYESRGIPFGGWLFRLARNTVIDHARTRHEHAGLDAALGHPGADMGPEEMAATRQSIETVGQALAALTAEQREVIALRFFAGLSAREAASVMGKQEGTIRGLQFRAIAALRRELGLEIGAHQVEIIRRRDSGRADMDELMNDRQPENRELARRLEAYADARLSPDRESMSRIRSQLMERVDESAPSSPPIAMRTWRRSRPRRLAISLLAASLALMLMAGAVAAARPGGPIYPIRIWVETATLPADPAARAAAELARLETRLEEASVAAAAGDGAGVAAALEAYRASLEGVIPAGVPDGAPPGLEIALTRHLAVLEGLTESVPEVARGAIQRAIERGSRAIDIVERVERDFPGENPPGPPPDLPVPPVPDVVPPGRPPGLPTVEDPSWRPGQPPGRPTP